MEILIHHTKELGCCAVKKESLVKIFFQLNHDKRNLCFKKTTLSVMWKMDEW